MISKFISIKNRMLLARRLKENDYKFRMHGYEYYIRKTKFVSILTLNPLWNLATIYKIRWNLKESEEAIKDLTKILKEIDSELHIQII